MTTQKITHRFNGTVLFECDVPAEIESGLAMRYALEKATEAKADLRDAYLRGADLRGADLRDAYLSGADLSGAYLRGADLRGADLRGAYLRDAYLRGADLSGAYLRDAYLRGADLSDAYLRDAYLSGADLSDAYLSDAYLRGAYLSDAYLRGADLKTATPEESVENLDKVRAIVLDNNKRLEMSHWHGDDGWKERTCAEETLCETTHCLAGWLQVCSMDKEVRAERDTQFAGIKAAPIAAKMFFREPAEVLAWLTERKYVGEIEEREKRHAERMAAKAAAAPQP